MSQDLLIVRSQYFRHLEIQNMLLSLEKACKQRGYLLLLSKHTSSNTCMVSIDFKTCEIGFIGFINLYTFELQTLIFQVSIFLPSDIAASHATAQVDEKNTVLTVPYYFTKKQRNVMTKCAEMAGFNVVQVRLKLYLPRLSFYSMQIRLHFFQIFLNKHNLKFQVINEPASACLAYSLGQLDQTETLKCIIFR